MLPFEAGGEPRSGSKLGDSLSFGNAIPRPSTGVATTVTQGSQWAAGDAVHARSVTASPVAMMYAVVVAEGRRVSRM